MAQTPRAPAAPSSGPSPWPLIAGVLALVLSGPVLLLIYVVADWAFVRGTLRALQVIALVALGALALGLVGAVSVGVLGLYTRWASPKARKAATTIAVARSRWPLLPDDARVTLTLAPPGRESVPAAQLAEPAPAVIEAEPPAPQLPPPPVGQVLRSLVRLGHICRSGNSLMVGYDTTGTPVYIELADAALIAIGGAPQQGKSSLAIFLVAQAAMMGWRLYICDPHGRHERGIIYRCAPLSGALTRQAVAAHEIRSTIAAFVELGRARINGDPDRTPAFLVIDEFPAQALTREFAAAMEQLISIGSQFPKVGLFIIGIGYEWNSQLFMSHYAASLRRLSRHRAVAQCDAGSAKFLITEKLAQEAEQLGKGEVYYVGLGAWGRLRVPLVGHEDLVYAADGQPPRPYTPEPEPAEELPALAESETVVLTLDERIVEVLGQAPGPMASGAIIEALGAEKQQVYNALNRLVEAGRVQRSGPRRAYLYALLTHSQGVSLGA